MLLLLLLRVFFPNKMLWFICVIDHKIISPWVKKENCCTFHALFCQHLDQRPITFNIFVLELSSQAQFWSCCRIDGSRPPVYRNWWSNRTESEPDKQSSASSPNQYNKIKLDRSWIKFERRVHHSYKYSKALFIYNYRTYKKRSSNLNWSLRLIEKQNTLGSTQVPQAVDTCHRSQKMSWYATTIWLTDVKEQLFCARHSEEYPEKLLCCF